MVDLDDLSAEANKLSLEHVMRFMTLKKTNKMYNLRMAYLSYLGIINQHLCIL